MIKNQNYRGGIYMILSVLFFSLMDVLIKVTDEYDVGQVMFFRAVFGLLPIILLIPKKKLYHMTQLIHDARKKNKRIGIYPISETNWLDVGEWSEYRKTLKKIP